jgi:hypothetical protein
MLILLQFQYQLDNQFRHHTGTLATTREGSGTLPDGLEVRTPPTRKSKRGLF